MTPDIVLCVLCRMLGQLELLSNDDYVLGGLGEAQRTAHYKVASPQKLKLVLSCPYGSIDLLAGIHPKLESWRVKYEAKSESTRNAGPIAHVVTGQAAPSTERVLHSAPTVRVTLSDVKIPSSTTTTNAPSTPSSYWPKSNVAPTPAATVWAPPTPTPGITGPPDKQGGTAGPEISSHAPIVGPISSPSLAAITQSTRLAGNALARPVNGLVQAPPIGRTGPAPTDSLGAPTVLASKDAFTPFGPGLVCLPSTTSHESSSGTKPPAVSSNNNGDTNKNDETNKNGGKVIKKSETKNDEKKNGEINKQTAKSTIEAKTKPKSSTRAWADTEDDSDLPPFILPTSTSPAKSTDTLGKPEIPGDKGSDVHVGTNKTSSVTTNKTLPVTPSKTPPIALLQSSDGKRVPVKLEASDGTFAPVSDNAALVPQAIVVERNSRGSVLTSYLTITNRETPTATSVYRGKTIPADVSDAFRRICKFKMECTDTKCLRFHGEYDVKQDNQFRKKGAGKQHRPHAQGVCICIFSLVGTCTRGEQCNYRHVSKMRALTVEQQAEIDQELVRSSMFTKERVQHDPPIVADHSTHTIRCPKPSEVQSSDSVTMDKDKGSTDEATLNRSKLAAAGTGPRRAPAWSGRNETHRALGWELLRKETELEESKSTDSSPKEPITPQSKPQTKSADPLSPINPINPTKTETTSVTHAKLASMESKPVDHQRPAKVPLIAESSRDDEDEDQE